MSGALRVLQRNALVYRRTWRGSIFFSFLQPLLFLFAMGLGLGALVDVNETRALGGVSYLEFVAPGLLAATSMQAASFGFSFETISKVSWRRTYEAMLATPLTVRDLVAGEMGWGAIRLLTAAVAFFAAVSLFRMPAMPLGLLAVPASVLTGLAVGAATMAYVAPRKSYNELSGMMRFVVTPMFLFSGAFFPVARLPEALQVLAYATPLFHGVELARGFMLASIGFSKMVGHLAYLVIFLAVGWVLANQRLKKRMLT